MSKDSIFFVNIEHYPWCSRQKMFIFLIQASFGEERKKTKITADATLSSGSKQQINYFVLNLLCRTAPDLGVSRNNQAISGLDYVSQKAIAVLQENVTRVAINIVIKQVKKYPSSRNKNLFNENSAE